MSITAKCRSCGNQFASQIFSFGPKANVRMVASGNIETCPKCGGRADTQTGTFDIVGGLVKAFSAPEMTRENIESARSIAKDACVGVITSEAAIQQLATISETLAQIVRQPHGRRVNWEFLLALLALIYTIWIDHKSDADARAALAESRTQTEVAQKMLEESEAQSVYLRELVPDSISQQPSQEKTNGLKNRGDKRRADAIERKRKKKASRVSPRKQNGD